MGWDGMERRAAFSFFPTFFLLNRVRISYFTIKDLVFFFFFLFAAGQNSNAPLESVVFFD